MVLCAWLALAALPAVADDDELAFAVTHLAFPSGLRLAVVADDTLPVLGATVLVDAGTSFQPADRPSMAHLVEHLWFRSRPGGGAEAGARLDAAGCTWNASTGVDVTRFEFSCPVTARDELLDLVASIVADPLAGVSDASAQQEVRTVKAEVVERDQTGARAFLDGLAASVHPVGHPYKLRHVTPDDVVYDAAAARAFVAATYQHGSATIVLAGAVGDATHDVLEPLVARLPACAFHPDLPCTPVQPMPMVGGRSIPWPTDPSDPKAILQPSKPTQRTAARHLHTPDSGGRSTITAALDGVDHVVAWRLPPVEPVTSGFEAWSLAEVLQTTARAAVGTVGVDDLTCDAMLLQEETLAWCAFAWGDKAKPDAIIARLNGMEDSIALPPITTYAEGPRYRWGKRYLYGRLEAPADTDGWRLNELAAYLHQGGYADLLGTSLDQLATGQTWRLAGAWLHRNLHTNTTWKLDIQPPKTAATLRTDGAVIETFAANARLSDAATAAVPAWPDDRVAERVLANGLHVVAVRTGTIPFVDVSLTVRHDSPAYEASIEWLVQQALTWSFPTGDTSQMRLDRTSTADWTEVTLQAPHDALDEALRVLAYGARDVRVDGAALPALRARLRRSRRWIESQGQRPWYDTVHRSLPSVSAGIGGLSDAEFDALLGLDRKALDARVAARWQPSGSLLLMVGDLDPAAAVARAERVMQGWTAPAGAPQRPVFDAAAPVPNVVGWQGEDGTMATVDLYCVAADTRPTASQTAVLTLALNRALMAELRTARGLAYTPWARASRVGPHLMLYLSATVATDQAATAALALTAMRDQVVQGALAASAVDDAVARYRLATPLRRQTRAAVRQDVRSAWLDGRSVADWARVTPLDDAITPASLASAAAGCPDQWVLTVDGTAVAIEAATQALMPASQAPASVP